MTIRLPENRRIVICCLLVFISTFLLFSPAIQHDFLNYDDDVYITENQLVQQGPSLRALYEPQYSLWHPVTTLSHQLDYLFYGLNPAGHRLGNILVHSFSAILVLLFGWRTTRSLLTSSIIAALFAWHPLRVESVVWIAERKDVLCIFFWLLTMHAYLSWNHNRTRANYIWTITAAALAMMSKPMAVTLPFTLILLDFWPLKRLVFDRDKEWAPELHRLVREKLPFFMLAAALVVITLACQSESKPMITSAGIGLGERLGNMANAPGHYLAKLFLPLDLGVFYPTDVELLTLKLMVSLVFFTVAVAIAIQKRDSCPQALWGLMWFFVILAPVFGLFQTGQSVADRYSYLPSLGIMMAVVIGAFGWVKNQTSRNLLASVFFLLILGCGGLTHMQISRWQDSETLFRHTLAVTKNNYSAHVHLAATLANRGDLAEAMEHYDAALKIRPSISLHYKLGYALLTQGKPALAQKHLTKAIELNPNYAEAHYQLAMALTDLGRLDEGVFHLRMALHLQPLLGKRLAAPLEETSSPTNGTGLTISNTPAKQARERQTTAP